MKRLLILNTNFPPSTTIGTQRILRISRYLDGSQWQLYVLSLKEKYYSGEGTLADPAIQTLLEKMTIFRTGKFDVVAALIKARDRFRADKGDAGPKPASQNNAQSTSSSQATPSKPNMLRRIVSTVSDLMEFPDKDITLLPFAVLRGWRIIQKHKIDAVFTSSPPHSLHLSGLILKRLTGVKFIADFRDPWARSPWHDDERASSGFEKWKHRAIQRFEKWVVRAADKVVVVSQQMKDDYVTFYANEPKNKFEVFFNGYDPEKIISSTNGHARAVTAEKPVVFTHTGTLYKRRDPTPVIEAVKGIVESDILPRNRFRFDFIGIVTSELAAIRDLVVQHELQDVVRFLPPVSYKESYEIMLNSDVLVLLQPITKLQIPGKFYDYLCFTKPMLAVGEEESAVQSLVKDKFGVFTDIQNTSAIQAGIKQLVESPSIDNTVFKESREFFNMSKSIKQFEGILADMFEPSLNRN